jgi:hypothetical protein
MSKPKKSYETHEEDVAQILGCKLSCSSGRKWFSKGDGKSDMSHPMPILFDAKSTTKDEYRLSFSVWDKLAREATMDNRQPVLPIRFLQSPMVDLVVIPTQDRKSVV